MINYSGTMDDDLEGNIHMEDGRNPIKEKPKTISEDGDKFNTLDEPVADTIVR